MLKHTQSLVCAIVDGRKPEVETATQSDSMSEIVTTFQWFVSFTPGSADARTVYGSVALQARLEEFKRKHALGEATSQDNATPKMFYWFLPEDATMEVDELAKAIAATASAALALVKSSKGSKASKSKDQEALNDKKTPRLSTAPSTCSSEFGLLFLNLLCYRWRFVAISQLLGMSVGRP